MLYSGAKGTMTPNNRLQRTALAIAVGGEGFLVADVQLALVRMDADDSATWPNMASQVRYFFIPVVAGAVVVAAVAVILLLTLKKGSAKAIACNRASSPAANLGVERDRGGTSDPSDWDSAARPSPPDLLLELPSVAVLQSSLLMW